MYRSVRLSTRPARRWLRFQAFFLNLRLGDAPNLIAMTVQQVGYRSRCGKFFVLPSFFNQRISDGLGRQVPMGQIRSQLGVCMAVRINQTLDIQEQLRLLFLRRFSSPARNVVRATQPALKLVDSEFDGLAVPAEDDLGKAGATVEQGQCRFPHQKPTIRPRNLFDEHGNESNNLFRNSIALQNTFCHGNLLG